MFSTQLNSLQLKVETVFRDLLFRKSSLRKAKRTRGLRISLKSRRHEKENLRNGQSTKKFFYRDQEIKRKKKNPQKRKSRYFNSVRLVLVDARA